MKVRLPKKTMGKSKSRPNAQRIAYTLQNPHQKLVVILNSKDRQLGFFLSTGYYYKDEILNFDVMSAKWSNLSVSFPNGNIEFEGTHIVLRAESESELTKLMELVPFCSFRKPSWGRDKQWLALLDTKQQVHFIYATWGEFTGGIVLGSNRIKGMRESKSLVTGLKTFDVNEDQLGKIKEIFDVSHPDEGEGPRKINYIFPSPQRLIILP